MTIVRRCNFLRCGSGFYGQESIAPILEDNLFVECGMSEEDNILPLESGCQAEGASPIEFKGNALGMLLTHNIIADNRGASAWWADCPGIQGNRVIGNAFWDNPMGAMDNEALVFDTMTQGNVMYRCGVHSRVATRWNLVDNLFVEGGVAWQHQDMNPCPDGYMLLRGNAFLNPKDTYLVGRCVP